MDAGGVCITEMDGLAGCFQRGVGVLVGGRVVVAVVVGKIAAGDVQPKAMAW